MFSDLGRHGPVMPWILISNCRKLLSMGSAAQRIIAEYDALPQVEQQQVLAAMLHRVAAEPHDLPSDDDLVAAADHLFQELDRCEQQP